jgi:hypothetical protein
MERSRRANASRRLQASCPHRLSHRLDKIDALRVKMQDFVCCERVDETCVAGSCVGGEAERTQDNDHQNGGTSISHHMASIDLEHGTSTAHWDCL